MNKLPVILLKGLVLLPKEEVKLELSNNITMDVVNLSTLHYMSQLLVICPKDELEENPEVSDLPFVGVVGKIKSKIELPNGNIRIIINGIERVKINRYLNHEDNQNILLAETENITLPKFDPIEETALRTKLMEILRRFIASSPYVSNSILSTLNDVQDISLLTDMISSFLPFPVLKKLDYMQEINALKRAENLIMALSVEIEILSIDAKIDDNIRDELENNQKDFILREKIRQIKKELGDEDSKDDEIEEYKNILESLDINEKSKSKLRTEIKKYEYTNNASPDSSMLRTYLDWVLYLPWNKLSLDNEDLNKIIKTLDKTHYGLDEVKARVLEYIAVKIRNPKLRSPIICLVGPPGVGKTSLAKTISTSLNKEFYKISVGGLNDSAELVGHRRTYLGSNPGKIIQAIKKCDSINPVILIDEIDKMVSDYKGDPASTLLDILDPEQNNMFIDNYIEEPFDLSNVLFILTANDINGIPTALKDRLEIINLSSYTEYEKIDIAKKYLLPNIYKDHLIKNGEIKIGEDVIKEIILKYTKEAGVRDLDRKLSTIVRKIVTESIKNQIDMMTKITKNDLVKYLNQPIYDVNEKSSLNKPGLISGLAYTPYGGCVLPFESCYYEGKGNVKLTGSLGKVMEESADIAISYIRSNKDYFKVSDYYFTNKDIHVNAVGATPKDGPSAGITLVTSILSLILNKIIDSTIGMTGEITLRGEVLKIGGLREKVIGAYNEGVKKIFLPTSNKSDLEKIPERIKEKIEFIFVSNYNEIYKSIFEGE